MRRAQDEHWNSVLDDWKVDQKFQLWRRHSDSVNSALLRNWLPARQVRRLLKTDLFDEAVADGLYKELTTAARHVVGVDLSASVARAAGRRYPELMSHAADIRRLPFADASFNIVISISTMDHFESQDEIQAALREVARVLCPGGQMLLTLDNLAHPLVWLRSVLPQRLLMSLGVLPYRVGKTLRPRRLRAMCHAVGLEVRESTAVMHCPRVLAVAGSRLLERHASPLTQDRFLAAMSKFERFERWPTRYLTGHFTAVRARKPLQERDSAATLPFSGKE